MHQKLSFYLAHTVLKTTAGYAQANRHLLRPGRKMLSLGHAPPTAEAEEYSLHTPQELKNFQVSKTEHTTKFFYHIYSPSSGDILFVFEQIKVA